MTDYKNLKLRASSNPHIRNGEDTRGLMLDVIIALMPALLFGVWHFGVRVAISAVVSVASAIFFEWLYRKLLHKPQMIGDLSAAVTGLLLSMVCPPELPVWMLVVGNFFAIFVVKQLISGSAGEVSALMLLIGGVYLIVRKVISWQTPVAYIATVAVVTFLFPRGNDPMTFMLYNVLGGGLFLGAFFMATDYVTSPVTKKGQLIFGLGCGLITVFIRYFGSYPEGVCYSILVMNCCTWIIDKYTKPTRFGVDKKAAKEAAKK